MRKLSVSRSLEFLRSNWRTPLNWMGGAAVGLTTIFHSEEDVTTIKDLAILEDIDAADEDWKFLKRKRYHAKLFTNGDGSRRQPAIQKKPTSRLRELKILPY